MMHFFWYIARLFAAKAKKCYVVIAAAISMPKFNDFLNEFPVSVDKQKCSHL